MLACWLAALSLLPVAAIGASAESFRTPSVSAVRVEWRAVLDQLRAEISTQPAIASRFTFAGQRRLPPSDPRSTPALVQLNAITSPIFAGIGRSPVPVLLPFDTASYLEARSRGAADDVPVSRFQADFRPVDLFHAGLAGYDANTWGGILAPAGTSKAVVATLNAEINKALAAEDVRAKLVANGIDIQGGTPARFGDYIKAEVAKWAKVTKDAGIEPE